MSPVSTLRAWRTAYSSSPKSSPTGPTTWTTSKNDAASEKCTAEPPSIRSRLPNGVVTASNAIDPTTVTDISRASVASLLATATLGVFVGLAPSAAQALSRRVREGSRVLRRLRQPRQLVQLRRRLRVRHHRELGSDAVRFGRSRVVPVRGALGAVPVVDLRDLGGTRHRSAGRGGPRRRRPLAAPVDPGGLPGAGERAGRRRRRQPRTGRRCRLAVRAHGDRDLRRSAAGQVRDPRPELPRRLTPASRRCSSTSAAATTVAR